MASLETERNGSCTDFDWNSRKPLTGSVPFHRGEGVRVHTRNQYLESGGHTCDSHFVSRNRERVVPHPSLLSSTHCS